MDEDCGFLPFEGGEQTASHCISQSCSKRSQSSSSKLLSFYKTFILLDIFFSVSLTGDLGNPSEKFDSYQGSAWDGTIPHPIPSRPMGRFSIKLRPMGRDGTEFPRNIPSHGTKNFQGIPRDPMGPHRTNIFCRNLFLLRTIWSSL